MVRHCSLDASTSGPARSTKHALVPYHRSLDGERHLAVLRHRRLCEACPERGWRENAALTLTLTPTLTVTLALTLALILTLSLSLRRSQARREHGGRPGVLRPDARPAASRPVTPRPGISRPVTPRPGLLSMRSRGAVTPRPGLGLDHALERSASAPEPLRSPVGLWGCGAVGLWGCEAVGPPSAPTSACGVHVFPDQAQCEGATLAAPGLGQSARTKDWPAGSPS